MYKRQTQYSLRALPVGGYVAFESMTDQVAEERVFQRQPLGHRFWVVLAGPLMNIIIAIVIAALVLACWGVAVDLPRVESVNAGSPAEAAGSVSYTHLGCRIIRLLPVFIGPALRIFTASIAALRPVFGPIGGSSLLSRLFSAKGNIFKKDSIVHMCFSLRSAYPVRRSIAQQKRRQVV